MPLLINLQILNLQVINSHTGLAISKYAEYVG